MDIRIGPHVLDEPVRNGDTMLTDCEKELIARLGQIYTDAVQQVIDHGPTRNADITELSGKIHDIQHMIMSQAAGRLYPELYRTLGNLH